MRRGAGAIMLISRDSHEYIARFKGVDGLRR